MAGIHPMNIFKFWSLMKDAAAGKISPHVYADMTVESASCSSLAPSPAMESSSPACIKGRGAESRVYCGYPDMHHLGTGA
jgi:hypothetical protein